MATVNRPPFWVPRPAEDQLWRFDTNWKTSAVIQILSAQKMFGVGGQVVTRKYAPLLTYDDSSTWYPASENLNSPIIEILTRQKIFGAGGQVATRNYAPLLTYDDSSTWYPASENLNSPIIEILTRQKIFGAGGQVATRNYAPLLTYDDPPTWYPIPENLDSEIFLLFPTAPFSFQSQWSYRNDHSPMWQGAPTRSGAIQATSTQAKFFGQPGQAPPFRWNWTIDDPPTWYPIPEMLDSELLLFRSTSPFSFASQWSYRSDESPAWQGAPIRSGAIQVTNTQTKFYGQSGQAPPFRWNWTVDDPPTWYPIPENLDSEIFLLFPATAPFSFQPRWPYRIDETAPWQWPRYVCSVFSLSARLFPQGGQSFPLEYDDPPTWAWPLQRNFQIIQPVGTPFENRQTYWYSEDALWQGSPARSYSITLTTTQTKFYGQPGQAPPFRPNWTSDDPSFWSWSSVGQNKNVLFAVQSPLVYPPRRWYSEDSLWQGSQTQNRLVVAPAPGLPMATFYAPRPASEEIWTKFSVGVGALLIPTTQTPFSFQPQRPYSYDDAAVWQGSPLRSGAIQVTSTQTKFYGQSGQVPPFRWNWTQDDPPAWLPTMPERNRNVLFTVTSPLVYPPRRWYSEDAFWTGSPLPSGSVSLTTTQTKFYGQPGQTPPFRPNLTYDDSSLWQWPSQARNRNVLFTITAPLVRPLPTFYSEDSLWQGSPASSYSITLTVTQTKLFGQPGQAPPFRWNWTDSDPSSWQWPLWRNRSVLQPAAPPLVHPLPTFYLEPPDWLGTPLRSQIIPLLSAQRFYGAGGQAPTRRWSQIYVEDDPPPHRQTTPSSAIIRLLTAVQIPGFARGAVPAHFYRYDYDEASTWWPKNRLVATLVFSILVPPPQPAAGVVSARTLVGQKSSRTSVGEPRSRTTLGRGLSRTTIGGTKF